MNTIQNILSLYQLNKIPLAFISLENAYSSKIYNFRFLDMTVPVSKVEKYIPNLELMLGKSIGNIQVRKNNGLIKIVVEKEKRYYPCFQEIYETFKKEKKNDLTIPIGLTDEGDIACIDFSSPYTCHVAIAGQTRAGKTEAIYTVINGIIKQSNPEIIKFVILDIKNRLSQYNKNPYLLFNVGTEIQDIENQLLWLNNEMKLRYRENRTNPKIFVFIDELAGLGKESKESIELIEKLASMGAEAGISLIVSSQKITHGIVGSSNLVNNFPCKIGLRMDNIQESYNFIGNEVDLSKLKGKGDCYIKTPNNIIRCQLLQSRKGD